ncbi:MAG TPA: bifunctional riboflavin kinase/FAD synthetase [Anaerolineaceae bacterium]|nr:bifunctional riboflavin kinase/FAD synthetase [Anaerolineaceae bacterium]
MQHLSSLDQIHLDASWVTIGSFDGVHRAHQEIVARLVAGAHAQNLPAVLVTFFPHPSVVLRGNQDAIYLTTPDERAELIGALGIDTIITLKFTRELSTTPAKDFIASLSSRLGMKQLWVGFNFALGRGREGDISTLRLFGDIYGYQLVVTPPVKINEEAISSSLIRAALTKGEIDRANRMLNRCYSVEGPVMHGDGRGRSIGIPTANLDVWPEQVIPAIGVYATWTTVDGQRHPSVTNIGVRPTFENQPQQPRVETLILDFDQDLYGKKVRVEFVEYLRGERKFPSVDALLSQIRQDIERARGSLTHEF